MLGYRLFVELADERRTVLKLAHEQLHSWLQRKGYDADQLTPGHSVPLGARAVGQLLELDMQDGTHAFRARIVEDGSGGTWTSQLTVNVPGSDRRAPWLWLDIESPENRYTAIPGLSRSLLSVLDGRDGGARIGAEPIRVGIEDVKEVVDAVCADDRRGLIFVAASDHDGPRAEWDSGTDRLLRDTVGLAAAYLLDPAATAKFNNAIGPDHAVAAWTVRTFRPGVEPDDPVDATRHRFLTTERIVADSDHAIARMLGRRAREAALSAPLPNLVARLDRMFERQIDNALLAPLQSVRQPDDLVPSRPADALVVTAPVSSESAVATPTPTTEHVDERSEVIREHLLRREAEITALCEELAELRTTAARQLEDVQLDYMVAEDQRAHAEAEVRYLRGLLRRSNLSAQAWSTPEVDEAALRPDDYEVLLNRITRFGHIQFTGDPDVVRGLDDHDATGAWAGKIWDALCALEDYATVSLDHRCSRDVHGYLEHTPDDCHTYSANQHARDESKDVKSNEKYSRARMLKVPTEVNSTGEVFMGAHFKIAKFGLISPRLHYYDDVHGTGKIYVGYIGPHLPTSKTN